MTIKPAICVSIFKTSNNLKSYFANISEMNGRISTQPKKSWKRQLFINNLPSATEAQISPPSTDQTTYHTNIYSTFSFQDEILVRNTFFCAVRRQNKTRHKNCNKSLSQSKAFMKHNLVNIKIHKT